MSHMNHPDEKRLDETLMLADLESDEPSVETLEWLKREAPLEVFRDTLRLILDGQTYNCDPETIAWAQAQLDQL